jgi:hypothetical protein
MLNGCRVARACSATAKVMRSPAATLMVPDIPPEPLPFREPSSQRSNQGPRASPLPRSGIHRFQHVPDSARRGCIAHYVAIAPRVRRRNDTLHRAVLRDVGHRSRGDFRSFACGRDISARRAGRRRTSAPSACSDSGDQREPRDVHKSISLAHRRPCNLSKTRKDACR